MTGTIHVSRDDIPPSILGAFPEYRGNKFQIKATDSVTLQDLNYSGGTRSRYRAVNIATGETLVTDAINKPAPWCNPFEGQIIDIPVGVAIVEHSMFCGSDHGLTVYARPDSLAPLLPAPEALSWASLVVLYATRCYKNTYAGKSNCRFIEATHETRISPPEWETAKAALIASGHLNRAGAIKNRGRNAVSHLYRFPEQF